MTKSASVNTITAVMLTLIAGVILSQGWLNDFEKFVLSKVNKDKQTYQSQVGSSGNALDANPRTNPNLGAGDLPGHG